ncbi:uncharacterized protein LOC111620197 [Centruroides sculpturatus]|uniref:uncharacterized protein LOC111620197 n=1 Tax=Centruroides sculpturatus TaxID=218467 RepID=UPI000C6CA262|nr:uncharacterized protein LOC111620197 [Centruroides sculpturatus]
MTRKSFLNSLFSRSKTKTVANSERVSFPFANDSESQVLNSERETHREQSIMEAKLNRNDKPISLNYAAMDQKQIKNVGEASGEMFFVRKEETANDNFQQGPFVNINEIHVQIKENCTNLSDSVQKSDSAFIETENNCRNLEVCSHFDRSEVFAEETKLLNERDETFSLFQSNGHPTDSTSRSSIYIYNPSNKTCSLAKSTNEVGVNKKECKRKEKFYANELINTRITDDLSSFNEA